MAKRPIHPTDSPQRLTEEITHLLNTTLALANHYGIDLTEVYRAKDGGLR